MEAGLHSLGIRFEDMQVVAQLGSTEAVISAVEQGLGISFVSKLAAAPAIKANRAQLVPTMETFGQSYYLSCYKGRHENQIVKEFVSLVKQN